MYAKHKLAESQTELSELPTECGVEVRDGHDLFALCIRPFPIMLA